MSVLRWIENNEHNEGHHGIVIICPTLGNTSSPPQCLQGMWSQPQLIHHPHCHNAEGQCWYPCTCRLPHTATMQQDIAGIHVCVDSTHTATTQQDIAGIHALILCLFRTFSNFSSPLVFIFGTLSHFGVCEIFSPLYYFVKLNKRVVVTVCTFTIL